MKKLVVKMPDEMMEWINHQCLNTLKYENRSQYIRRLIFNEMTKFANENKNEKNNK